jgi:hypothetical protein
LFFRRRNISVIPRIRIGNRCKDVLESDITRNSSGLHAVMAPKRKAPGGSSAQTCPASPAKPEPELFSDCRMLFWATHLTSVMQQRVKQLGGNVHAALAPNTTHIICAPDITPLQAAAKLASWKGCAVQCNWCCWAGQAQNFAQISTYWSRRPWREVHTGSGETVQLPVGVAFVRLDWVARSIAMQARQPVDDYVPQGLAAVPLPQPKPTDATAAQEQPGDQQAPPKQTSRQSTAPSSQQPREQRTSGPAATAPQASSSTSTQPLSAEELAAARQDVQQGPLPPCTVARQRSEFVAVQGVRPRFTGGDTGIPWGTAGVWDEPYDDEAARWALLLPLPPLKPRRGGPCAPHWSTAYAEPALLCVLLEVARTWLCLCLQGDDRPPALFLVPKPGPGAGAARRACRFTGAFCFCGNGSSSAAAHHNTHWGVPRSLAIRSAPACPRCPPLTLRCLSRRRPPWRAR